MSDIKSAPKNSTERYLDELGCDIAPEKIEELDEKLAFIGACLNDSPHKVKIGEKWDRAPEPQQRLEKKDVLSPHLAVRLDAITVVEIRNLAPTYPSHRKLLFSVFIESKYAPVRNFSFETGRIKGLPTDVHVYTGGKGVALNRPSDCFDEVNGETQIMREFITNQYESLINDIHHVLSSQPVDLDALLRRLGERAVEILAQ